MWYIGSDATSPDTTIWLVTCHNYGPINLQGNLWLNVSNKFSRQKVQEKGNTQVMNLKIVIKYTATVNWTTWSLVVDTKFNFYSKSISVPNICFLGV